MFARIAVVIRLIAVAVAYGARPSGSANAPRGYVVRPGDTLWTIAAARYPGARIVHRLDKDTSGVMVLGLSRRAAQLGSVSIEVLRPVPSVALIPLAMLAFGFGVRMELAIVAFATFWPLLVLVQSAVQQIEPRLLEVSRVLGLSARERAFKIVLPAIVPRLFVALRLGVAVALVVAVTVEIAANPNGMGYAMMIAQQSFDPALMLAWLGWIGVVGFAVNAGMLLLQRAVARRMGVVS